MIVAIVILIVGILTAVVSVLLRKKLGQGWMASIMAAGLLIAFCGGWFTVSGIGQQREIRENIFLGLQYLKDGQNDSAAFYFKKAGNQDSFAVSSAKCLLEAARGNDLNARLNLDSARSMARSSEEEELVAVMEAIEGQDTQQISVAAAEKLEELLGISADRQKELEFFVQAESGGIWDASELASAGIDENTVDRLNVSRLLAMGSYQEAVSTAAALADRQPNEENRLLLAEAVGESAYNDVILTDYDFQTSDLDASASPQDGGSAAQERSELQQQRKELESDLEILQMTSSGASQEEAKEIDAQKLELTEEIEQLQNREDKLFVYRAFNAIADLHSLKAQIVRARLYFALEDHDKAVETLLASAGSIQAKLTPDRTLANQLSVVEKVYSSGSDVSIQAGGEFEDAMVQLLSSPFSDLMYVSQNRITQDFAQKIVTDQKVYSGDLFVTRLDTSAFPQICATLSGEEEVLQKIVEKQEVSARDTRAEIEYTAVIEEQSISNICVVVDRSGSMGGDPMADLKAALEEFFRSANDNMFISLVAFDNVGQQLTEMTTDKTELLTKLGSISANGGTNITDGIREGISSMENSGGVMLLMTDGQSDVDFSVVEEAAACGIIIHTIGFGGVDDALLERIAQETGGQYIRADSSSELSNVYSSLQQVIGNVLTLEYTAPSPETVENRYFFLKVGDTSVRKEYFLTDEKPQNMPQLYQANPALIDPQNLEDRLSWNGEYSFEFSGENLQQVTQISIGGYPAQISGQDESWLRAVVTSPLPQGWQTVEITLEDGSQQSYDRLLVVGPVSYYENLRLGSLTVLSARGVVLDDDTLVLSGPLNIVENRSTEGSTLSLQASGTLIFPWKPLPQENGITILPDTIDLGDQGTITGWGQIFLNGDDGAYESGVPTQILKGEIQIECTPEQSKLIQNIQEE